MTVTADGQPEPAVPEFTMEPVLQAMLGLPRFSLALAASWWEMGLAWSDALHAPLRHHFRLHAADDHAQLVVPEPIEETGEHALFA